MYEYVIYQLPHNDKRLFRPDDTLRLGDYVASYCAYVRDTFALNDLETIFALFNQSRPKNFAGHSLSVSDAVRIIEGSRNRIFICDSFGWKEKNWEEFIND